MSGSHVRTKHSEQQQQQQAEGANSLWGRMLSTD